LLLSQIQPPFSGGRKLSTGSAGHKRDSRTKNGLIKSETGEIKKKYQSPDA
jgi:hypothetical protein